MISLWRELLSPQPIEPFQPTREDFDKAWNWIFEKDSSGNYKTPAVMVLKIVRNHALSLARQKVPNCAECAVVGFWKRMTQSSIPERRTPIKAVSGVPPRRK